MRAMTIEMALEIKELHLQISSCRWRILNCAANKRMNELALL